MQEENDNERSQNDAGSAPFPDAGNAPNAAEYAAENGIETDSPGGNKTGADETGGGSQTGPGETENVVPVETLGGSRRGRHKRDCACARCVARREGKPLPPRGKSVSGGGKRVDRAAAEKAANMLLAITVPMQNGMMVSGMESVPLTQFEIGLQRDAAIDCFLEFGIPSGKIVCVLVALTAISAPIVARGVSGKTLDDAINMMPDPAKTNGAASNVQ